METALSTDMGVIILEGGQGQDRQGAGRSSKSKPHFCHFPHWIFRKDVCLSASTSSFCQ